MASQNEGSSDSFVKHTFGHRWPLAKLCQHYVKSALGSSLGTDRQTCMMSCGQQAA